jgi:histidine triad (HIT) family protein
MDSCIFCKILAGQAPASILYQDEWVTAFLDIRPVNAGHALVIPNRHAASLAELDEESGRQLFPAAQRIAAALYASGIQSDDTGLRCEAVNFFLADGEAAGQDVFHVHLHVIPRYARDGFGLRFPTHYFEESPSRAELDELADEIRARLEKQPGQIE